VDVNYFCLVFFMTVPSHRAWISNVIWRVWRPKNPQTTQCWVSEEFEDTKESTNRQHNAEYQKSLKIQKNPQTDNTMLSIRRVWRYKRIHKQTTHWPKEKGQKNKQRSKNRGWTQMLQNGTKNRGWTQMLQNGTKNRGWTQMLQNDTNNPGVNSDAPEWH
jgi:hypothetical protein